MSKFDQLTARLADARLVVEYIKFARRGEADDWYPVERKTALAAARRVRDRIARELSAERGRLEIRKQIREAV